MFDLDVITERVQILERKFRIRLHEYSVEESRYISEVQLESKRNPKTGKLEGLNEDEQVFILNEVLLSRASFPYWFPRYPKLILDDATGEIGHPSVWKSQEIMLKRLAAREKTMWDQYKGGQKRFGGNKWYVHKARQMGLSSICQGINVHAVNFYSQTNCLVGSTTLPKTQELHRDYGKLMWSTMPDWMKVPALKDHSEQGLVLQNGSKIVLQHSEMESGFGQGAKWHRSHLTEIASWKETGERNNVVDHIDNHYDPAVSRSIKSAAFLESTSQGMDNYWHRNTELARAKKLNDWWYLFIGWWLIPDLYISEQIPAGWEPQKETIAEEELIIQKSPEWNDGWTYRPSQQQMYWWELKRAEFQAKALLNEFYKNYPSIPEQSFTHSGRSSFTYDVLQYCDSNTRDPLAYYDIITNETPSERVITEEMRDPVTGARFPPPPMWDVPGTDYKLAPVYTTEEERADPLGLVLVWEFPKEVAPFDLYGGVDTTDGIQEWSRHNRKKDDENTNNAAISLIRSGTSRDVDVLEFAAPITPKPLARLYNALARIWVGRNAIDGQTPTIVELTGDGLAFQEELIASHQFFAFYQHYEFNGGDWKETNTFGWKSNPRSIRFLWNQFKSHTTDRNFITRSRFLVREMRSCTDDQIYIAGMTRGKAPKTGGRHDDRVYSRAFALWYANSWANPEPKAFRATVPKLMSHGQAPVKLHQMDFSSPDEKESYLSEWEERILGDAAAGYDTRPIDPNRKKNLIRPEELMDYLRRTGQI